MVYFNIKQENEEPTTEPNVQPIDNGGPEIASQIAHGGK